MEAQIEFIKTELVRRVFAENACFRGLSVISSELTTPKQLDGFMSTIHQLVLVVRAESKREDESTIRLLVKVMKGNDTFRKQNLGHVLFPNEINIYANVLPAFDRFLEQSGSALRPSEWCPRTYLSAQGHFPGYSSTFETFLVMENVTPRGFRTGPRLDLDEAHLTLMAEVIAKYHACSYAMRIREPHTLERLVEKIIPLNFLQDGKVFFESYNVVFRLAAERLFAYVDANPDELDSDRFRSCVDILRTKYGPNQSLLMQQFLERDPIYSVILHGDYNRNNVLFRYVDDRPVEVLMIDFQENRYGSPALDLSFFMYMNMTPELRERFWDELLARYHRQLMRTLCEILQCAETDERLAPYREDLFRQHFARFALYGAMVALNFIPWMMSPEEECADAGASFEQDVHSEEFRRCTLSVGGEPVNRRITAVMRHACKMGYMDMM
ncbi:Juvenile hormone-inducible protein [Anopheles darlingi]|uniref:Juvenile hormone-inducible protein n=1 Tax=Anopheles darlingi TaxID=43151 RepID=W5JGB5_ANODA|nr:Juvenile hormone-inducible protein [Anopheles darlingi]